MGDQTYGSFSFNRDIKKETGIKRLMLHSNEILLSYRFEGKVREVAFRSKLPTEFDALLGYRPGMDMASVLKQKVKISEKN